VITDEALTELLTFCAADRQLRVEAALVLDDVLATSMYASFRRRGGAFSRALALYQARPDKGYSLPDCISLLSG
jgi:hypothetical protein